MKSFLSNSKQYTETAPKTKVSLEIVRCGVPQRAILTPFLLVLYVNDLKNTSRLLYPVMFTDDANLFYTATEIYTVCFLM